MPRKSKASDVPTLAEIAAKLAVSPRRVSQLKGLGMPVHSIESALAWRMQEEMKTTSSGSADELRREKIRLTQRQSERIELQLEIERGKYISREECQAYAGQLAIVIKAGLLALEKEIPCAIQGLPSSQVQPKVRELIRGVLEMMADQTSRFWKQHPASS